MFSDANTVMGRDALRAIARNFSDPSVGGVVACTAYHIHGDGESSRRGESLYWRYDTWQGSGGDYREALFERLKDR